ncbi:hypothetical protein ENUP19_0346G0013 [Entamoeba nuttalli]|uniref:RhoGAP domain containing protein n=2 Tax=Entamoeba nuttalli TaxID=412467 RepID=K2I2G2_ENTNP|nr:RhoGAP domain containing protein [Entamoeba nuttalli P19]EKE43045.1 RhoGAP domain containing protein [Entamoeba nuttalli P19]|eukprot:XP_008854619.1 RhoGAP domain containing protein [Entamoeba nuttalli P19]
MSTVSSNTTTKVIIRSLIALYANQAQVFTSPTYTSKRCFEESLNMTLTSQQVLFYECPKKSLLSLTRKSNEGQIVGKISLIHTKVQDNLDESSKDRGKTLLLIETLDFRQRTFVILFSDKTERNEWKNLIKNYIITAKKKKVLGIDLKELRQASGEEIPPLLLVCIDTIKEHPNDIIETLPPYQVQELINSINNNNEIKNMTASVAWTILKLFLMSLPTPLLHPISSFLSINPINIELVEKSIRMLPIEQRLLLDKILEMFVYLNNVDPVKYAPHSIAHSFALYLGWVKTEAIPSTIYDIVEFLITQYHHIFNLELGQQKRLSKSFTNSEQTNKFILINKTDPRKCTSFTDREDIAFRELGAPSNERDIPSKETDVPLTIIFENLSK